ncbi:hypothetical protein PtA15_12A592, partial [Puccinia triticina]
PQLIQVAANDPFFNKDVIRLKLIKQACESEDEVKATSWKILYQMMMRTDSTAEYTQDKETRSLFSSAFRKLHTLAQSSYRLFHHFTPVPPTKLRPNTDSLLVAGTFVIDKIRMLDACANSSLPPSDEPLNPTDASTAPIKPARNSNTPNGLVFLQKRVWEMMLCCLMMQHSKCKAKLAASKSKDSKSSRHWTAEQEQQLMKFDHSKSLYNTGDLSATPSRNDVKRWSKMRLSCFGSMAVFFLYGAAGWWHGFTDSHNYNKQDVWALVHLAHAKHEWLYEKGHSRERRQADTPWYCFDSFIRWLLSKAAMDTEHPEDFDWEAVPSFLASKVTEARLSRFALQDILAEVCCGEPEASGNYNGYPAPDVNLSCQDRTAADRVCDCDDPCCQHPSHFPSSPPVPGNPPSSDNAHGHAADDSATDHDPSSSKIHSKASSPNPATRPTTKNNTPVKRGRKLIAVVVPSEQVCSTKKMRVDLGEANATLDRDELDADAEEVSSSDEE